MTTIKRLAAFLLMLNTLSASGRVAFEGLIHSSILGTNRMVRIYLPPSYERDLQKRYPVLYVHDGQNAFSTAGPHAAFGWGSWMLDKTADEYIAAGKLRELMIVAIDCSNDRYREYRGPRSNSPRVLDPYQLYARFLIEELKPKIDREYRTLAGPGESAVLGSSMGGICSLALGWDHPDVFGGVASLSGAFQVEKRAFIRNVLGGCAGRPKKLRIYLDSGVTDYSGGDDGKADTEETVRELRRIGYKPGKNFQHFIDAAPLPEPELRARGLPEQKVREALRSQHNELYWRLRAWRPLTFLFPPEKKGGRKR